MRPGAAGAGRAAAPDKASESEVDSVHAELSLSTGTNQWLCRIGDLLGRNAELGDGEVWHRGASRLVEGCLSTLLPRHNNEARERAREAQRSALPSSRRRDGCCAK